MEQPNLSYITKISKGDKDLEKSFIQVVKEDLLDDIKNYHFYIKENNLKKTKENVHKIKHKMSILGLVKSYEITNDYENNLRENSLENRAYFESMLPIMVNFIKTL